ncbi:CsgG/HfaB family protein [Cyclobacteriaceae bacterium]|nr:CsgG/HfaB family protein [Cyclobacteriaceae bacterium]
MKKSLQKLKLSVLAAALLFSTGVFSQVKCYVLQAPEKIIPSMRKLAIIDFKDRNNSSYNYWNRDANNDYGSMLADQMLADLMEEYRGVSNTKYNYLDIKTNVYTVVERGQIDQIMQEQKLGAAGAITEGDAAKAGKLLGLDVILTGNYSMSSQIKTSKDKVYKTVDEKQVFSHYSYSKWRETSAEVSMKIISVETGQVLAFIQKSKTSKTKAATSTSGYPATSSITSEYNAKSSAIKSIARVLTGTFVPSYKYKNLEYDKAKNKANKDAVKTAKKLIKQDEINAAFHILKNIMATDDSDEAVVHNLAIIYEAVGLYDKAIKYHKYADQLSGKKKYEKALKACESGKKAVDALTALGIEIKPYDFGDASEAGSADAEMVKIKGSSKTMVNVYTDSNKGSKVVKKVKGGKEYKVIERKGSWIKIEVPGLDDSVIGYIMAADAK